MTKRTVDPEALELRKEEGINLEQSIPDEINELVDFYADYGYSKDEVFAAIRNFIDKS